MRHLAAFLVLAMPASAQTTWFVDASAAGPGTGTAADPFSRVQAAIDAVATLPGDTVAIAQGRYQENIDLRGKDLVLDGSAAATPPIIDGLGSGSTLTIASGETSACVLRGLVIEMGSGSVEPNGETVGGGALVANSAATFISVTFRSNAATRGGGLAVVGGSAVLINCSIIQNQSEKGGGLYLVGGDVVLRGGSVQGNEVLALTAPGFGGGVHVDSGGQLQVTGATIAGNRALYFGGGGGLYVSPGALAVEVLGSEFSENLPGNFNGAGAGGAILAAGALTCRNTRFERNGQVAEEGVTRGGAVVGGFYVDCHFIGNSGQQGGAMASAIAERCVFEGNSACAGSGGRGGATSLSTLTDCDLMDNYACGLGGAAAGGSLHRCRVINNLAGFDVAQDRAQGGGIYGAIAVDTLIEGNRCASQNGSSRPSEGGGAYDSTLERCSILSNSASIGGGVFGGTAVQCTLAGNLGETRSGAAAGGVFQSSILWYNFPPDSFNTATFSYSNVESALPTGTGNISADPLFFGNSAADIHLRAGSPSIDTGAPFLPLDGDGSPADMGSLPFDATWVTVPASYCQSTGNGSGCFAKIEAAGPASLSTGITLQVTEVPAQSFGLFFIGTQANFQLVPAGSSSRPNRLCVGGAITRTAPLQSTGGPLCAGVFNKLVTPTELLSAGAQPGTSLYCQLWFRGGTSTTAMSNAIFLPIEP